MRISDWSSDVCSSDLHRSQSGQDAGRYGHIAPLLYPGVPGNADAAQLGQLFAAQARRTPPGPRWHAPGFGLHSGAPAPQKVAQRLAPNRPGFFNSCGTTRLAVIQPRDRKSAQVGNVVVIRNTLVSCMIIKTI